MRRQPCGRLCETLSNPEPLEERDFVRSEKEVHQTGFHPRARELSPLNFVGDTLKTECKHLLRTEKETSAHQNQPLQFQLWLRAGTKQPIYANKDEENFNASIWRNFRKEFGFQVPKRRTTHQLMAAMYPLNIPPPSRVGVYTYEKFLDESSVIKDAQFKKALIEKASEMGKDLDKMDLRTNIRNPPVDQKGNILPPPSHKRFGAPSFPPPTLSAKMSFLEKAGKEAGSSEEGGGGGGGEGGEAVEEDDSGGGEIKSSVDFNRHAATTTPDMDDWRQLYVTRRDIELSPLRVRKEKIFQKKPGISINSTAGASYSFENQHNANQGFHLKASSHASRESLQKQSMKGLLKPTYLP